MTTRAARAAEEWFKGKLENGIALSYREAFEAGVRWALEESAKALSESNTPGLWPNGYIWIRDIEALVKEEGE